MKSRTHWDFANFVADIDDDAQIYVIFISIQRGELNVGLGDREGKSDRFGRRTFETSEPSIYG